MSGGIIDEDLVPPNDRLKAIASGDAKASDLEAAQMASDLLSHRRRTGESPEVCEGCDSDQVTTHDVEGVPLCDSCAAVLTRESPQADRTPLAKRPVAPYAGGSDATGPNLDTTA